MLEWSAVAIVFYAALSSPFRLKRSAASPEPNAARRISNPDAACRIAATPLKRKDRRMNMQTLTTVIQWSALAVAAYLGVMVLTIATPFA
jgi:hypothetical protein